MKTLTITAQGSRKFTAAFEDGTIVGIEYPKWYSMVAVVTVNEKRYGIIPKGFWKSRYEIIIDNKLLFTITHTWSGCSIVKPNDPERPLAIKPRGFFKGGYVLTNYKNEVLLEVTSDFSWKKFAQNYTISYSDTFGETDEEKVLMFFSVYYAIIVQTAAASGAA